MDSRSDGDRFLDRRFIRQRMTRTAVLVFVVMCALLAGFNMVADYYFDVSGKERRFQLWQHCDSVETQLRAQVDSHKTSPGGVPDLVHVTRVDVLRKSLDACLRGYADSNTFEKFGPPEKATVGGVLAFFLSSDSAGHLLYKMLLAVVYTALFVSLAIMLLSLVEARFVTGKPIAELIETVRGWIGPETSSGGAASAFASMVGPLVLATPVVLGATLALRADPVELKLAASDASLRLRTELQDVSEREGTIRRTVEISVVPAISTAASGIPLPITIQPTLEKRPITIPVKTSVVPASNPNQTIVLDTSALERRFSESIAEQRSLHKAIEKYLADPVQVTVPMGGVTDAIRSLNETQRGHLLELRGMNYNLDLLSKSDKASVKSGSLVEAIAPRLRD